MFIGMIMIKKSNVFLAFVLLFGLLSCNIAYAAPRVYYIDRENGNDQNDGLSINTPWQTHNNIATTEFFAGDSYCFFQKNRVQ